MKRITSNKKGFTLLEVMLAVAIMAVSSSMIMVGFLTTMTYSRNSALYSRVGSSNYTGCITTLSSMVTASNRNGLNPNNVGSHSVTVYGTTMTPDVVNGAGTSNTIKFGAQGSAPVAILRLEGDLEDQISPTDGFNVARGNGTNFHTELAEGDQNGGASYGTYNNDATYSDNRTTLFYYMPLYCPICADNGRVGTISYAEGYPGGVGPVEGYYCTQDHTPAEVGSTYQLTPDGHIKIGHLDTGSNTPVLD